MPLTKKALTDKVDALFSEEFSQYDVTDVPVIEQKRLTHGASGVAGEFTFLYVDMRRSSELANSHRRQTVARIFKAFHYAMVEIVKDKGGSVRSFDGDRVMAVFGGDGRINAAVEAALLMKGAKMDILAAKIKSKYQNETFDLGIGIASGPTLCIKAGVGYDANNRDLVWIGNPPNLGAKLSDGAKEPDNTYICATTFNGLSAGNRHTDHEGVKKDMWVARTLAFGGQTVNAYSCSWYRHLA